MGMFQQTQAVALFGSSYGFWPALAHGLGLKSGAPELPQAKPKPGRNITRGRGVCVITLGYRRYASLQVCSEGLSLGMCVE
ncbi:hypothetical protein BDR06DRAFT_947080 [Suillus hirtellus]|nr:hypothetical protein BDR06DRAFT_947080 [Suillus hirtellus]